MISLIRPIFLRRICVCAAALFCAMLIGGCGSSTARLEIQPNSSRDSLVQSFPQACLSVSEDGDYDIVLVSEGLIPSASHGRVLEPSKINALRQIVHIHVLWRPLPGTRADQPTATNSVIDWFVMSNMPDSPEDRITYRGAGFVAIYPNSHGAHVVIRNANMALSQKSGDLVDPFGPSTMSGAFDVVRNDGLAHDLISSAMAPATPPTASTQPTAPEVRQPVLPQLPQ